MDLRKIILSFMAVLMLIPVFSQSNIDYGHKTLANILLKEGIKDLKTLKEIVLTDSKALPLPINGKYFEIENGERIKYIYVGRVNTCRAGGCTISDNLSKEGNSEYFDYFILFDKNVSVHQVKVFNYQATHGHEITAKGWLKQFVGLNGNKKLTVGKEIDSVSGATISVNAVTSDIMHKTELLKKML